jgi:hypothetical protein
MSFPFEWNPYADQPHNVAGRAERRRHHLKHAGSYFEIAAANLRRALPVLRSYRRLWRGMYASAADIGDPFACAVSDAGDRSGEAVSLLGETGARATIVRIGSWERDVLDRRERFVRSLRDEGFEVALALLQRRDDVLEPAAWRGFLEEIFGRFGALAPDMEIGHAWNRTKWGVWDHREYLRLAEPAFELAPRSGVRLVGPAIIDFEFHLYPVTLPRLPFDRTSSLLYVDRMGAPENAQFGWSAPRKLALLKAVVDACARPRTGAHVHDGTGEGGRPLWITEVNWPLEGTGAWSPASGKPNVSEEAQADFLVRYYVLCAASGLVERIYWWQLAAPGYGLVDSRETPWRRRPSFRAFRTLAERLRGGRFLGTVGDGRAGATRAFLFRRDGRDCAVCWSADGAAARIDLPRPALRVVGRDGEVLRGRAAGPRIEVDGRPVYVELGD